MKELPLKFPLIIIIGFIVYSCNDSLNDNYEENKIVKNETNNKTLSLKELGYNSFDEMLKNGWEIIKKENFIYPKNNNISSRIETTKERLTIHQLRQIGYPDNDPIIDAYRNHYKDRFIRSEFLFNNYYGYTGPLGVEFKASENPELYNEAKAYIEFGETKITTLNESQDGETFTSFGWIKNLDPNLTDTATREILYSIGEEKNWHVTASAGITMRTKATIPFVASAELEVSIGLETGGGGSTSTLKQTSTNYTAQIPPKTKRQIILKQKIKKGRYQYQIPINLTGDIKLFGRNESTMNQYRYFFAPINILNKDKKEIGQINYEQRAEVEVIAGPAIPLTQEDYTGF